jgi:hypothetical protein
MEKCSVYLGSVIGRFYCILVGSFPHISTPITSRYPFAFFFLVGTFDGHSCTDRPQTTELLKNRIFQNITKQIQIFYEMCDTAYNPDVTNGSNVKHDVGNTCFD